MDTLYILPFVPLNNGSTQELLFNSTKEINYNIQKNIQTNVFRDDFTKIPLTISFSPYLKVIWNPDVIMSRQNCFLFRVPKIEK